MSQLLDTNESENPTEGEFELNNDELALLARVLIKKQEFAKFDTSTYDLEFSRRMKVAIRESDYHDWVQEQFAQVCKVKQNTVSTWITGLRKPEVETGIVLCKLLNISFDWFYT